MIGIRQYLMVKELPNYERVVATIEVTEYRNWQYMAIWAHLDKIYGVGFISYHDVDKKERLEFMRGLEVDIKKMKRHLVKGAKKPKQKRRKKS